LVLAGPKPRPVIIPTGVDRQQQMEAFIPTQPVAPANIRQAGQPARATALGIPRAGAGAVDSFVRAPLGRQELDERQKNATRAACCRRTCRLYGSRVGSAGKAGRKWHCASR